MKCLGLIFLLLISGLFQAQTTIKGTLKDEKGNPVMYANIFVKLAKVGAVSSETGEFSFVVGKTGLDTLIVSCVVFLPLDAAHEECYAMGCPHRKLLPPCEEASCGAQHFLLFLLVFVL